MNSKKASINELMRAQQSLKTPRNINDPHAKLDSRNRLTCVVCGIVIKSEILWKAHVLKKSHKENLDKLKQAQKALNNPLVAARKRKAPKFVDQCPPKKLQKTEMAKAESVKPKGILKSINYDSSSSSEDDTDNITETIIEGPATKPESVMDDMDTDSIEKKIEDESDPSKFYLEEKAKSLRITEKNTVENLPEKFFDDPIQDAKVRKVEFIDKDMAEWDAFTKDIEKAESTSFDIIALDTEQLAKRNQLDQAEILIEKLRKAVNIGKVIDAYTPAGKDESIVTVKIEDDSSDDDDLEPFSWRSKGAKI